MNNETLYFEGDSVSFGEEGKFYKWFIPFPLDNWSFEEVTRDEYERAIGAGLACVPDKIYGPGYLIAIGNNPRRIDPVHQSCCSNFEAPVGNTPCLTNWRNRQEVIAIIPKDELMGRTLSCVPQRSPIIPINL